MRFYYDLHIHSLLSPCGDDDMTPNNIVNMSLINELDHRSPYTGFTSTNCANNVVFMNMEFQHHENRYTDKSSTGSTVLLGTYEIGATKSNNVYWIGCTQTNFFEPDGGVTFRGLMGTNFCKNLYFKDSILSSFDAHCGTYNATLENSICEHINFIGEGTITLKNMTIYADASLAGIKLRDDYGSTWQGDLVIDGLTIKYSSKTKDKTFTLATATFYNHNFGYQTYLPENIWLNNVKMEYISAYVSGGVRYESHISYNEAPLHIYSGLEKIDADISDPTIEYPTGSGATIINPYEPTKNIYVTNCGDLKIIYPNTPQFAKMNVYVDGKLFYWRT